MTGFSAFSVVWIASQKIKITKEDSTALWPPHRSPALSLVFHIPQSFGSFWAQAAGHKFSMAGGEKEKQGSWSCGSRTKANAAE